MLLADIKKLFIDNRELCASEIRTRLHADSGLIDHALEQLIEKGFITEVNYVTECRGCSMKCSARGERVYRIKETV